MWRDFAYKQKHINMFLVMRMFGTGGIVWSALLYLSAKVGLVFRQSLVDAAVVKIKPCISFTILVINVLLYQVLVHGIDYSRIGYLHHIGLG